MQYSKRWQWNQTYRGAGGVSLAVGITLSLPAIALSADLAQRPVHPVSTDQSPSGAEASLAQNYSPGSRTTPKGGGTSTGIRYRPSNPSAPRGGSTVTGVRGGSCEANSKGQLTVLAPVNHVGLTASTQPTLVWYVPDTASYPLEVSLFDETEGRSAQPIHIFSRMESKAGLMPLSLAAQSFRLTPGRSYRWQVVLVCNPNRPSASQVAQATLQVVAPTATLQAALANSHDRLQRATVYAEAGFWYDALTEMLADSTLKPEVGSLLKDLGELEPPTRREQLRQVSATLK